MQPEVDLQGLPVLRRLLKAPGVWDRPGPLAGLLLSLGNRHLIRALGAVQLEAESCPMTQHSEARKRGWTLLGSTKDPGEGESLGQSIKTLPIYRCALGPCKKSHFVTYRISLKGVFKVNNFSSATSFPRGYLMNHPTLPDLGPYWRPQEAAVRGLK